jgi:hypothetical protein
MRLLACQEGCCQLSLYCDIWAVSWKQMDERVATDGLFLEANCTGTGSCKHFRNQTVA